MAIQRAHINTRLPNDLPGPLVVFAAGAEVHTNSGTLGRTVYSGLLLKSMTWRTQGTLSGEESALLR